MSQLMSRVCGILLALCIAHPALAGEALPAGQAFHTALVPAGEGLYLVEVSIAAGHYIYSDSLTITASGWGARTGRIKWPAPGYLEQPGKGLQRVYSGKVRIVTPIQRGSLAETYLVIRFNGCAESGVCYPMMTREYTL